MEVKKADLNKLQLQPIEGCENVQPRDFCYKLAVAWIEGKRELVLDLIEEYGEALGLKVWGWMRSDLLDYSKDFMERGGYIWKFSHAYSERFIEVIE